MPRRLLRKHLEGAGSDQLPVMVQMFAEALMGTEADRLCGASYGERSADRVNQRNGYRTPRWDTRVGSIDFAIPKLRCDRSAKPGGQRGALDVPVPRRRFIHPERRRRG